MEYDFYDQVWFWNNHSDYIKKMLGRWIGVSHRVGSTLCYWILSNKGNIISCTTVQNITADKSRYLNVQERICDYHGLLEAAFVCEGFGTSLYGY